MHFSILSCTRAHLIKRKYTVCSRRLLSMFDNWLSFTIVRNIVSLILLLRKRESIQMFESYDFIIGNID